ncbi:hypothetical protein CsSME_00017780 [Camellia sinensis var. sinensis]
MSMSASLSFLQSACAYSQQQRLYLRPKLECLGSSSSYEPLIVEAKARTRREDRAARHSRTLFYFPLFVGLELDPFMVHPCICWILFLKSIMLS